MPTVESSSVAERRRDNPSYVKPSALVPRTPAAHATRRLFLPNRACVVTLLTTVPFSHKSYSELRIVSPELRIYAEFILSHDWCITYTVPHARLNIFLFRFPNPRIAV